MFTRATSSSTLFVVLCVLSLGWSGYVVNTTSSDWLERLVSKMTYNVLIGTINPTHSLHRPSRPHHHPKRWGTHNASFYYMFYVHAHIVWRCRILLASLHSCPCLSLSVLPPIPVPPPFLLHFTSHPFFHFLPFVLFPSLTLSNHPLFFSSLHLSLSAISVHLRIGNRNLWYGTYAENGV